MIGNEDLIVTPCGERHPNGILTYDENGAICVRGFFNFKDEWKDKPVAVKSLAAIALPVEREDRIDRLGDGRC